MKERLQKVLARAGVASRRKVEELIRDGRVTVNGHAAAIGESADLAVDAVKVDGKRIVASRRPHRHFLIHKPAGYVSTVSDPEGRPTVMELLPLGHRGGGLVPVGRLDYESEGLLLLTDDGELAQKLSHPRYGCRKTYEVKVKGMPDPAAIAKLRSGIVIDGQRTAAAEVEPLRLGHGKRAPDQNSWWKVVLGEGRNRQVREMFFRIGHPVSRLKRVAIGALRDPHLPRGDWRALEPAEVDLLKSPASRLRPPKVTPRVAAGDAAERAPREAPLHRKAGPGGAPRAAPPHRKRGGAVGAPREAPAGPPRRPGPKRGRR